MTEPRQLWNSSRFDPSRSKRLWNPNLYPVVLERFRQRAFFQAELE